LAKHDSNSTVCLFGVLNLLGIFRTMDMVFLHKW